jgi:hypothetical protein
VGFLHSGWTKQDTAHTEKKQREMISKMLQDNAPRFEMDDTNYGMREGALRDLGDGITYARIREVVLPFHTFIPAPPNAHNSSRISVPIDDETSAEWYVLYNTSAPLDPAIIKAFFFNTSDDPDNFAANLGDKSTRWDQDREAMKKGHFSGLTKNLSFEDFIVQASMGRRFDRSKEQLGSADAIVVRVRRLLLDAAKAFERGAPAPWNASDINYRSIRARSVEFEAGRTWLEFVYAKSATKAEAVTR